MEKENTNVKIKYKVVKASKEQNDLVFDKFYKLEKFRKIAIVFVAIADDENVIGYLVIEPKTVPQPVECTNWFMWNIFTQPEFRRQGIATALVQEAIKYAKQANIRHIQGSCTKSPAHMFWKKNNFCFIKYGKKFDNINSPLEYGNYPHMISYRINKSEKVISTKDENYQIIKADRRLLNWIFDEYILNETVPFFHDKKEDIFGLTAIDKDGNVLGFITALSDEIGTPIDDIQWWVPYIFVRPELRRQGIGSSLLSEMIKSAKKANVMQLICTFSNGVVSEYWYNNNFDTYFWGLNPNTGKQPVAAALRLI